MRLDSARELKAALLENVVAPLAQPAVMARAIAVAAGPLDSTHRTIALGVARKGQDNYQLAVRVQRPELINGPQVELIQKRARGEADVRYIGRAVKLAEAAPWYRKRCRPLRIGCSIGHFDVTAGTLGCFVTNRTGDDAPLILSNNHVLANENNAKEGDAILQPGSVDGGKKPADAIGKLQRFVKLKLAGHNQVDAAVASIKKGIKFAPKQVADYGPLAGLGPDFLDHGTPVHKIGRTTGPVEGRVTAFELDNVVVAYDAGPLTFDGQVEIEGAGADPFAAGGDSGSLIIDADVKAVALVFATSEQGGANGRGLTFANPIRPVLDALKVKLLY